MDNIFVGRTDFGDADGSDVAGRVPSAALQAAALELLPDAEVGPRVPPSLRH